jgi:endogenous inhibitor of DNA gyrase (YacG/DUF329 family)
MQFECPTCKKPVSKPIAGQASFFPFCSERCRLIDLGQWLDEKYRVPVAGQEKPDPSQDDV